MALIPQFGAIVPAPNQQLLASAYLAFDGAAGGNFAQQYLPELYEQEVERYGNRTLSGFLRMVGAEMPMTSDQVIWSEQNRLHIAYDGCVNNQGAANPTITIPAATAPGVTRNVISPGQTIVVMDNAGNEAKCYVSASNTGTGVLTVQPYLTAGLPAATMGATVKIFVYGSEFQKGASTINAGAGALADAPAAQPQVTITPSFTQFSNSPIIIRNVYTINGSDMAQIGWVEVATEDGTTGYLWYLKAESETRLRFEDYLEMVCVEGELTAAGSGVAGLGTGLGGTQGLFSAIAARGNVEIGFAGAAGIDDFDEILKNLDTQGAIEENMLFLDRSTSLEFDNMLGAVSQGICCKFGLE